MSDKKKINIRHDMFVVEDTPDPVLAKTLNEWLSDLKKSETPEDLKPLIKKVEKVMTFNGIGKIGE